MGFCPRSANNATGTKPVKDTHPHIEKLYRDMIMSRSGVERLKMGCSMHTTAKKIVRASILETAPQATEEAMRHELFLRFYANDFDPDTRKKILQALETFPTSILYLA
jgi:hypothetical protein